MRSGYGPVPVRPGGANRDRTELEAFSVRPEVTREIFPSAGA